MSMSFERNLLQILIRILLVRHTHLLMANDLFITLLIPLAGTDEVLRLEGRVAEEVLAGDHVDELLAWEGFPHLAFGHDWSVVELA